MKPKIERVAFLCVVSILSVLVVKEGRSQVSLENQLAFGTEELYDAMANGQKFQLIDTRPLEDDNNEDVGGYEYTHIPGSIPFPGCDETRLPDVAKPVVRPGIPTVIISAEGAASEYEKCASYFHRVRNLDGGMLGWVDEFYPEDEGEYSPPKMGAGGGCL